MKKINTVFLLFITIILTSCIYTNDDDVTPVYPQARYEPIFMERAEFENTTQLLPTRSINNSGKIYVIDSYLFINEVYEGFHIINNSNPENPENIAFLKVIGSSDISIKNNSVYIDNASDLIALKFLDNYSTIEITKRINNIFPNPFAISPDGAQFYNEEGQVVIGWNLIE